MTRSRQKRQRRLRELLASDPPHCKLDMSGAIKGLQFGPTGEKVRRYVEQQTITGPDGKTWTVSAKMKEISFPIEGASGEPPRRGIIRLPEMIEDREEWRRTVAPWTVREKVSNDAKTAEQPDWSSYDFSLPLAED